MHRVKPSVINFTPFGVDAHAKEAMQMKCKNNFLMTHCKAPHYFSKDFLLKHVGGNDALNAVSFVFRKKMKPK